MLVRYVPLVAVNLPLSGRALISFARKKADCAFLDRELAALTSAAIEEAKKDKSEDGRPVHLQGLAVDELMDEEGRSVPIV